MSSENKTVIVRYKVHTDKIEDNKRAIEAVFAELKESAPSGFSYRSMSATDGTFVHVATMSGDNPLATSAAFKAFQAGLKERCVEPPAPLDVTTVGQYAD